MTDFERAQEARIIGKYAGFIKVVACKLANKLRLPCLEAADLEQAGFMALFLALRNIRWEEKSGSINAYLKKRIWGGMIDEIRAMFPLPRNRARRGVTLESREALMEDSHWEVADGGRDLLDMLDACLLLNRVRGRNRGLAYRYVVLGETMKEIGQGQGLTESRISQILKEAFGGLR